MKTATTNYTWLYKVLIAACFLPFVSPALALAAGITFSLLGWRPKNLQQYTSAILQGSIVLMGFGMQLTEVVAASKNGFIETCISVILVMLTGLLLGHLFKVEKNISLLIAAGTAICGGSAIAAVSPILNSKSHQNSFALIVVFVLNAVALVVFPLVGHTLGLSQEVFGNWAAIAIHDTSSVVGAGAVYGEEALQIATTVKLIRALWIIPLSIVIALFNKTTNGKKVAVPWFILLFVVAILFAYLFPSYSSTYEHLYWLGKRGMVVALLLIGSGISVQQIKQSGFKSFALGLTLWIITGVVSLIALMN
ncbi:YeiH family protein [Carboxylicivirga taeanensis]|uniref:YeiH family protein n=1 Tax=Carboxylicivirga taeanensis TaxID=1416875 RepID=UPI003F6DF517